MKTLLFFMSFLCMASVAAGDVWTKVYLADGNTPLELVDPNVDHVYRDIMVGTKLTIIVSSDVNEPWKDGMDEGGSLAIEEEYWDYGVLSARGPQIAGDWSGSHFPAAGDGAAVYDWEECWDGQCVDGFDMYTGFTDIEAGRWFIIDYTATGVGDCNVGFYDHLVSWIDPNYYLTFSQVRTRDFNGDGIVNFTDFAVLAFYWQENSCNDLYECDGADLNTDGNIDLRDLMLFADYWLEKTE